MFEVRIKAADPWEALDILTRDRPEVMNRRPLFLRLDIPEGVPVETFISGTFNMRDERILDPDGPCGLVKIDDNGWCFLGWYRPGTSPLPPPRERLSLSELVALEGDEDDELPIGCEAQDYEPEDPDGD
jgi:hypothetical protein